MSDDYRKKYNSSEWKERRQEILKRDDFECQVCGDDSDGLHVHHITPVSEGGSDDHENLKTLCPSCHMKAHTDATIFVEDGRVLKEPEYDWLEIAETPVAVANPECIETEQTVAVDDPDLMKTKRTDGNGRLYLGKEFAGKHILAAISVKDDGDDGKEDDKD